MNLSKQGQLEIKLYREMNKNGKEQVYMTDPENFFGNGVITYEQFKEEMKKIRRYPELLSIVKEAYFVPLMQKYTDEGGGESELAEQYLIEMGLGQTKEDESRYTLPKSEVTRIKKAFTERKNKITPTQRNIFKEYDLICIPNGNRATITPKQGGERIVIGICPNDVNAGRRISSLILKLCDEQYRKKIN